MARIAHVTLVDDLDGGQPPRRCTSRSKGRPYEIDLSDENAAKLRDASCAVCGRRPTRSGITTSRRGRAGNLRLR